MISILAPEMELIDKLFKPLQKMAIDTVLDAKNAGLNIGVYSTLRNYGEQNILFFKGRNDNGEIINKEAVVTNARAGMSWHNYGLALDIVFKSASGQWTWSASDIEWSKLGEIGVKNGFDWGGDWSFKDMPHFQYTKGIDGILVAKHIYEDEGLDAVLKMIKI